MVSRKDHKKKSKSAKSSPSAKYNRRQADENMTVTELQSLARSRGIPFGGLRKTQLIKKINEA